MSPDAVHDFLAQLLSSRSNDGANATSGLGGSSLQVSDAVLGLIKTLISIPGVVLSPSHVGFLTSWFERCRNDASAGMKPAKLASTVHTMIAKHSTGVAPHKARLEQLVVGLNTFMTKASVALLNKL